MFTTNDHISDRNHLIETILRNTSVPTTKEKAEEIVSKHLEHGVESYHDGVLAGYMLVFNFFGKRSLHGYKFIKGHALYGFQLARKMVKDFGVDYISTTVNQSGVIRFAKMLGFKTERRVGNGTYLSKI